MRKLMISLDKKILDPNSAVARRMVEYGKENELFIIIPSKEKKSFDLSPTVHVQSTGGNKWQQFWWLWKIGKEIIGNWKLEIGNCVTTTQAPFFTGLVGWLLKQKFEIQLEVQMHGDFFGGYYKKQWLKLCLAKFILKRADTIRVVGERIKQSLVKFGVDESKIQVRPIFVDIEWIKNYQPKIDLRKKYPGYEKIFLVLGRFDTVKNITWIVGVFREVLKQKNYLLLIIGSGQEEGNIRSLITDHGLSYNIKLVGWTNDAISYLKTVDCLLFPSLSEGYGLVAMEAHAVGTSIIMNDVGVANYELKPSEKVKIIPVSDRDAWIEAILSV